MLTYTDLLGEAGCRLVILDYVDAVVKNDRLTISNPTPNDIRVNLMINDGSGRLSWDLRDWFQEISLPAGRSTDMVLKLAGHMDAVGYLLTAKMIASYIDYIVRHSLDDFKQIGFD